MWTNFRLNFFFLPFHRYLFGFCSNFGPIDNSGVNLVELDSIWSEVLWCLLFFLFFYSVPWYPIGEKTGGSPFGNRMLIPPSLTRGMIEWWRPRRSAAYSMLIALIFFPYLIIKKKYKFDSLVLFAMNSSKFWEDRAVGQSDSDRGPQAA